MKTKTPTAKAAHPGKTYRYVLQPVTDPDKRVFLDSTTRYHVEDILIHPDTRNNRGSPHIVREIRQYHSPLERATNAVYKTGRIIRNTVVGTGLALVVTGMAGVLYYATQPSSKNLSSHVDSIIAPIEFIETIQPTVFTKPTLEEAVENAKTLHQEVLEDLQMNHGNAQVQPGTYYGIQVLATSGKNDGPSALMSASLENLGIPVVKEKKGKYYTFIAGRFNSKEEAETFQESLHGRFAGSHVTTYDGKSAQNIDMTNVGRLLLEGYNGKSGFAGMLSDIYDMPVNMILAVARTESGYDTDAHSHAGAIGLMQVMPATASDIQKEFPLVQDITDPVDNILAGVFYLDGLVQEYNSDENTDDEALAWALCAYNGGKTTVSKVRAGKRSFAQETKYYPLLVAGHETAADMGLNWGEYEVVRPGDTLGQIAKRASATSGYLKDVNELWNPGFDANKLQVGEVIALTYKKVDMQ